VSRDNTQAQHGFKAILFNQTKKLQLAQLLLQGYIPKKVT
jgi:hypothetical protein